MQWTNFGKSARYAGELVAPEPLDAVRLHLPFLDFVAAPSRAGQRFQHIIVFLHFYCDIVAVSCESEMGV